MSLWVNLCPAVCMWLCVNYPVYISPVFWVWFSSGLLVTSLVYPVSESCLVLPWCLIKDYYLSLCPRLCVPVPPSCVHRDACLSCHTVDLFFATSSIVHWLLIVLNMTQKMCWFLLKWFNFAHENYLEYLCRFLIWNHIKICMGKLFTLITNSQSHGFQNFALFGQIVLYIVVDYFFLNRSIRIRSDNIISTHINILCPLIYLFGVSLYNKK